MAISEIISIDSGPTQSVVARRARRLRAAAAVVALLALLLEVTASFAARRTHGAPQYRTYSAPKTTTVIDPRC